jgi:SAM-dependent methyltransferase
MTTSASERQKAHYESIHDDYESHYFDEPSMAFRERFIYDVLFDGFDFNGQTVADLACASGYNSVALKERFPEAETIGFDISARAVESYQRIVGGDSHELDLTKGELPEGVEPVDAAMVIGGLHHCVVDLPGTFRTLAKLVKPGGVLMMYEPNAAYLLEKARKVWYRFDRYFDAETEEALDHDRIADMASADFSPIDCHYMGGPAYFLIYNSLIVRMPKEAKARIQDPVFKAEQAYNHLPGKRWYPYFIARWRRRD